MTTYTIRFKIKGEWITWKREGANMEACLATTKTEIEAEFGGHGSIYITKSSQG